MSSQPTIRWLVGYGEALIETGSGKSVGILRKSGGVKSPKKNNLLLFVRESMQQWRAFRRYFNFQLNDKNCESAVLISNKYHITQNIA
ncbi:hypothetical protein J4733_07070 [Klebsiella pneumoniae]|uniref:Uncharacterized protein n=1 Tax=Klebsiella pneumoniae TaxID=573 RepID=A0A939NSC4_KLEPN|nr:hypothetical protein [Klebsiella pneumoniae]